MKNTTFMGIIHGILALLFSFVMIIAWMPKDFQFWCLLISVLLCIGNSYALICYLERRPVHNSSPMDRALFIPVAAEFLAVLYITWKLPVLVHYSCNKYLAVHVVVFAVSILVQLLLIRARSENTAQEQYIFQKRWKRDESVSQWEKIRTALSGRSECAALAKKIKEEIQYSDPVSSELLADLEEKIRTTTDEVLELAEKPGTSESEILRRQQQVLALVYERNDKCARLK